MNKQIVAVAVGGVWLAAAASAVMLVHTLNQPLVLRTDLTPPWRGKVLEIRPERPSADPQADVLVIPTLFIVGTPSGAPPASFARPGVAEMQPPDEIIIGPGVVTHPK